MDLFLGWIALTVAKGVRHRSLCDAVLENFPTGQFKRSEQRVLSVRHGRSLMGAGRGFFYAGILAGVAPFAKASRTASFLSIVR